MIIQTMNVRGLRDAVKRSQVFRYIRGHRPSLISLQETHTAQEEHELYHTQSLAQTSVWTPHTALLLYNSEYQLTNIDTSNSRIIIADLIPSDPENSTTPVIQVVSVYAPSTLIDRAPFFRALLANPRLQRDIPCIILGDFNFDFNNREGSTDYGRRLQESLTNHHEDIATFHRGNSHTRIDYILTSPQLDVLVQTSNTKITPASLSDHCLLELKLQLNPVQRGRGWWKMNNSILTDKPYQTLIKESLTQLFTGDNPLSGKTPDTIDPDDWENVKAFIRQTTMSYCKRKARTYKQLQSVIRSELSQLTEGSHRHELSEREQDEASRLVHVLDQQEQRKLEGQAIRSRIKWREAGEKPTQYFYRALKSRQTKAQMTGLTDPLTNEIHENPEDMLHIAERFYSNLFTPEHIDNTAQQHILAFLNRPEDSASLSQCLVDKPNMETLKLIISNSAKNRSPGADGISFEFYHTFIDTCLTTMLLRMCTMALEQCAFPPSWKQTHTILLFKKGERTKLENWRPIALINTDCKLFTRMLASRLNQILPQYITPLQTGFVQGRFIADNAATAYLVMQHARQNRKQNQESKAILLMDQEKAYDRVHASFMKKIFDQLQFPPSFTRLIDSLFFQAKTCIVVNGHISKPIAQLRGLRQGDPLSPLLFNLAIEPFLGMLQYSIRGYNLNSRTCLRSLAYADDILIFLDNNQDLDIALQAYSIYSQASNAKLNESKTEGLVISGSVQRWKDSHPQFKWYDSTSPSCPTYLGFPLSLERRHIDEFLDRLVTKMETHANILRMRNLTMVGKAMVCNSLLTSKLWYYARVLPFRRHYTRIRQILQKFLWYDRKPMISWEKTAVLKINGGLGIIQPEKQIPLLIVKHLLPAMMPHHPKFSFVHYIAREIIQETTGAREPEHVLLVPKLYLHHLKPYFLLHTLIETVHPLIHFNQPLSELKIDVFQNLPIVCILNNDESLSTQAQKIAVKEYVDVFNHTPIFVHKPIRSTTRHRIVNRINLQNAMIQNRCSWISSLQIPDWPRMENIFGNLDLSEYISNATMCGQPITDIKLVLLRQVTAKHIVQHTTMSSGSLWERLWSAPIDHKAKIIWWKLIHRSLPTRVVLQHRFSAQTIPSANCKWCNRSETIPHFIIDCPIKKRLWLYAITMLNIWLPRGSKIPLSEVNIANIETGFHYPSQSFNASHRQMMWTIYNAAILTIWNNHWQCIFSTSNPPQHLTYHHLRNDFRRLFCRSIRDRHFLTSSNPWLQPNEANWLHPTFVYYTNSSLVVNLPTVYISPVD